MNKDKILKYIDVCGEYLIYLFIFALFFNTKLIIKFRYPLEVFAILKLILDWKNIRFQGKKIYISFAFILCIGILFNLISSHYNGVSTFLGKNTKFLIGVIFLIFASKIDMKKISYTISVGLAFLVIGIAKNLSYMRLDIIHYRAMILLALCYLFVYFFESFKQKKDIINIVVVGISILFGLYGMVLGNSRMGFLGFILVILGYIGYNLIYYRTIKKMLIIGLILLGSLGIAYKILPVEYINHMKTSFKTHNNGSNEARIIMWQGTWNAYKSSPIIGVGSAMADTQPFVVDAAINSNREQRLIDLFIEGYFGEAHSIYLNILSQVGLLIFGYFFIFFYLIPYYFIKGEKNPTTVGSLFAMGSFLFYGLSWSVWGPYSSIQVFFQVFLALMLIAGSKKSDNKK